MRIDADENGWHARDMNAFSKYYAQLTERQGAGLFRLETSLGKGR